MVLHEEIQKRRKQIVTEKVMKAFAEDVRIVSGVGYSLLAVIPDVTLRTKFKKFFTTKDEAVYRKPRAGLVFRDVDKKVYEKSDYGDEVLQLEAGLINHVFLWLHQNGFDHEEVVDTSVFSRLQSSRKYDITNSRLVDRLRDDQIADCNAMFSGGYGGIASQYTSYGKTHMMMVISDFLDGRVVILAPTNSVAEEIMSRTEDFEIKAGIEDWSSGVKVNIINPLGFMNSSRCQFDEAKNWLSQVDSFLIDECHHVSANTYGKFFNLCPSIVRSYGFSSTPNTLKKMDKVDSLLRLGLRPCRVMGRTGLVRVSRKSKASVKLVRAVGEMYPQNLKEVISVKTEDDQISDNTWLEVIDYTILSDKFLELLCRLFNRFPETRWFIPIHKIETGYELFQKLQRQGHDGIFWSAQKMDPVMPTGRDDALGFVKETLSDPKYKFLMATTVGFEGINIPALNGVIPLTGKSLRSVIQPAGRSARNDSLVYVLIYDTNNPLILTQSASRRKIIEAEYSVSQKILMSI